MGEVAALTSALLWALASLVFVGLGARLPTLSLNLLKTAAAWLGLALTMVATTGRWWPEGLDGAALGWIGLSGVIGLTVGDTLYFISLVQLGPQRALILWALTPAVTAGLAAVVLGEAIDTAFFVGLVVTSVGVAAVLRARVRPGVEGVRPPRALSVIGLSAGVGAVLCQAGGSVTAKLGGVGLSGLELTVVRLAFGTVALVGPGLLAMRRRWVPLSPGLLGQVGLGTFLGTYLGIWLSMIALQNAPAGVVATLQSTSPVFVLPLARIFLGERIAPAALVGAAIAVIGVGILTLG